MELKKIILLISVGVLALGIVAGTLTPYLVNRSSASDTDGNNNNPEYHQDVTYSPPPTDVPAYRRIYANPVEGGLWHIQFPLHFSTNLNRYVNPYGAIAIFPEPGNENLYSIFFFGNTQPAQICLVNNGLSYILVLQWGR